MEGFRFLIPFFLKIKYTESELRKRLKGYNKNRYNAAFLISQLDTAIVFLISKTSSLRL